MKVAEKYTDTGLIAAIGDPKELNNAILFLYQQYYAGTSSFVINSGGSRQDADDIFQETVLSFIEIIRKGRFRMEASIATFLVSIARNLWLNEVKKRERAGHREQQFEKLRGHSEQDISQQLTGMEDRRQLRELVFKLGEPCRKLLMLFYYENLSMKEIVDHLPYENEQVVRNKKYKCLQQLTGYVRDNPAIARQLNEIAK